MTTVFVRIPEDRVGVLIGPGGQTRRELAAATHTEVTIESDDGEVRIDGPDDDPDGVLRARGVVLAIGRGFSPPRAARLLKPETYLGILDIKVTTGHRDKAGLRRIRSRVIGTRGQARARIEDLSGCSMSVYGSTVALIGTEEQLARATRAVELLLRGSEHATVFHLLARLRRDAALEEALGPGAGVPGE